MAKRAHAPTVREHHGTQHGYPVVYEETPTGWGAFSPELPGLGAAGTDRATVERLMDEAIPAHIESLRTDRLERPWLYTPDHLADAPELAALFRKLDAQSPPTA